MKLVQKQLFRGTREVEVTGTLVEFRVKSAMRENRLSVELSMLRPEAVRNGAFLEFRSRVNDEPLLSLLVDKPDAREFEAFVSWLKQRIREEFDAFAGLRGRSMPAEMAANEFAEPPDFDTPAAKRAVRSTPRPCRECLP